MSGCSDDDTYLDAESDADNNCLPADKRQYHNMLERKRRDHIKDQFNGLRDVLPNFKEKKKASRAQILKEAVTYIQASKRRNSAIKETIENLKKENFHFEEQIQLILKAKEAGNFDEIAPGIAAQLDRQFSPLPPSESDSDDSDQKPNLDSYDGQTGARRKRIKTSHKNSK